MYTIENTDIGSNKRIDQNDNKMSL